MKSENVKRISLRRSVNTYIIISILITMILSMFVIRKVIVDQIKDTQIKTMISIGELSRENKDIKSQNYSNGYNIYIRELSDFNYSFNDIYNAKFGIVDSSTKDTDAKKLITEVIEDKDAFEKYVFALAIDKKQNRVFIVSNSIESQNLFISKKMIEYLVAVAILVPLSFVGSKIFFDKFSSDVKIVLTNKANIDKISIRELYDMKMLLNKKEEEKTFAREREKNIVKALMHDIRTPLSIIKLHSELRQEDSYDQISEQSDKLDALTNKVLKIYVSKSDLGYKKIVKIIEEIVESEKELIKDKNLNLAYFYILGDRKEVLEKEFALIASNYISNAIKYSTVNSDIEIKIDTTKEDLEYEFTVVNTVEDSNIDTEKIWNEFEMGDKSRKSFGGFGLAVVKELSELNKKDECSSKIIQGNKIVFTYKKG